MFRKTYFQKNLIIPASIQKQLNHTFTFNHQFVGRFVQHIPDVGFRMIRYYGFLATSLIELEENYFPSSINYSTKKIAPHYLLQLIHN